MDGVGRLWELTLRRPPVPHLTTARALEAAATLAASGAMAMLVAVAGNALSDLPTASTTQAEVPATSQHNGLLFCTVEAEGWRCIEEAS